MADSKDQARDFFLAHEQRRYLAYSQMCSSLREFHAHRGEKAWPISVLSHVADATFSDGAAFVVAKPEGALDILASSGGAPGNDVKIGVLPQAGDIWTICTGKERLRILNCRMTQEDVRKLGVDLPVRSSIMAQRLEGCHACVCVWRHETGGREHSADAYEVYDCPALELAAQMTSLTMDVVWHIDEIVCTRVRSTRKSMERVCEIVHPKLISLHQMVRDAPGDIRRNVGQALQELDQSLETLRQEQVLGYEGGEK